MIIYVHISNDSVFCDEEVYITIDLPCVPNVGDILTLHKKQYRKLEKMAKETTIEPYSEKYGVRTEEGTPDFFMVDVVSSRYFNMSENTIHVELSLLEHVDNCYYNTKF